MGLIYREGGWWEIRVTTDEMLGYIPTPSPSQTWKKCLLIVIPEREMDARPVYVSVENKGGMTVMRIPSVVFG